MPKYRILKVQTITTTYEVTAPSSDEAENLATTGNAEEVDYENETHYETKELEEA